MYKISKRMEIAGAHKLNLPYESKCSTLHGHNWVVVIYCASVELTDYGMVIDFTHIKKAIHERLDHKFINDVLPSDCNPTAENMARWICEEVQKNLSSGICYKVKVQESEGNVATYKVDDWKSELRSRKVQVKKK